MKPILPSQLPSQCKACGHGAVKALGQVKSDWYAVACKKCNLVSHIVCKIPHKGEGPRRIKSRISCCGQKQGVAWSNGPHWTVFCAVCRKYKHHASDAEIFEKENKSIPFVVSLPSENRQQPFPPLSPPTVEKKSKTAFRFRSKLPAPLPPARPLETSLVRAEKEANVPLPQSPAVTVVRVLPPTPPENAPQRVEPSDEASPPEQTPVSVPSAGAELQRIKVKAVIEYLAEFLRLPPSCRNVAEGSVPEFNTNKESW